MALSESEFQQLLHTIFGKEKAEQFPAPLVAAMREFSEESFTKGVKSQEGIRDQAYDQGFAEGFDSGCHQAYVEVRGNQDDEHKAHAFMVDLRKRHLEGWKAIAKSDYSTAIGQIYKKPDGRFGWRVVAKDGRIMAVSAETFTSELGAKIEAKKQTGMAFL